MGNLLLVWARAVVFAHLNNLPLVTSYWWGFRWGAWKRNERRKRLYYGYFKESSFHSLLKMGIYKWIFPVVSEPPIVKLAPQQLLGNQVFIFHQVAVNHDLFGPLRHHRSLLTNRIYELLSPALLLQANQFEAPVIAVHIRRGDFKLGNPITPLSFFIDCIKQIRDATAEQWMVTIFTDAAPEEVAEVMALPGTTLAVVKPDILDILLMSKSRVMVLSQSSTFGYWAAFLSEAIVIRPATDWQQIIKTTDSAGRYDEVRLDLTNTAFCPVLKKKIAALKVSPNNSRCTD